MTREQLLLELKDIQAPVEPGWWLPAPGHLGIAGIVLISIVLLWQLARRRRVGRMLTLASAELERIKSAHADNPNPLQLAQALSLWQKKVSLLAFPEHGLEGKTGAAWLSFLDQCIGDTRYSSGDGRVFGDAIYRREADIDSGRLLILCEQWLSAVKPWLLKRGRE